MHNLDWNQVKRNIDSLDQKEIPNQKVNFQAMWDEIEDRKKKKKRSILLWASVAASLLILFTFSIYQDYNKGINQNQMVLSSPIDSLIEIKNDNQIASESIAEVQEEIESKEIVHTKAEAKETSKPTKEESVIEEIINELPSMKIETLAFIEPIEIKEIQVNQNIEPIEIDKRWIFIEVNSYDKPRRQRGFKVKFFQQKEDLFSLIAQRNTETKNRLNVRL